MAVTITCEPAAPASITDFCRIDVAGADQNTNTGYNAANYPASPEVRYYLTFELGGEVMGRSYEFAVSADGDHTFDNYVFPDDGSWTVRLNNAADDSSVATQSVTVS